MYTRSSSNLPGESFPNPTSSNPKRRNRRRSKQPFILEESPVATMADQRTMEELLCTPTEGYAEAIVVPPILAEHFELKHSLINIMTSDQFFGLEKDNPHDHIRAVRRWLKNLAWEDLVSKFINEFFPPSRTTNLRNEISNFKQRFDESFHEAWDRYKDLLHACPHHDQDSLNSAAGGNLLERRTQDVLTIIENKSKMNIASTSGSRPLPSNTIANPKGELKAITTRSGIVLDGPSIPIPLPFINPEEDERIEETLTDPKLGEFTIKVPPPLVQKDKPLSQRNYVKMLKALLSNKEKLLELENTPLNENCSAVILKKLHEKLRDLGKFLIPCGFSELKCKALADLGASINLMPLSVLKRLGLPKLIFTQMTLELANRAICTPARIARNVFVPVGKFTLPAEFVIVDYENDPKFPLILGRPFLRTGRAMIDVHGKEMILRDGDERLTLNTRHDTSSYSNQPQKESINVINIYDDSCKDYLEDLFAINHQSCNLTFSSHTNLTSPKVKDDIFDPEGDIVPIEKLPNLDSTKDLPPPHNINLLSGSTTSSSPDQLLEEFADELALITFPPRNDDIPFDIESDLREIEYFLNHDPTKEMDYILEDSVDEENHAEPNDNLFDTMPEMFTDEHTLDYSSPPLYDEYDDDLFELESNNDDAYNDPFDSTGEKNKVSKLLINELDLPRSSDFFLSPGYYSFLFEDFFEVDALPSTNNEDKVFNSGILIHENLSEDTVQVTPDKNVKNISISHASLILEDFDPPLYELPFHKEVPGFETLLSFSSKNKEKVFKPGILTSKGVHTSLLPELSHRGPKAFKVIKILESPMKIFPSLVERKSVFWMFRVSISIPRAELVLEAEELMLPLAGAEEGLFIVIPFKVLALNVDFDFKIDLIVFGPKTGSTSVSFSSGGRGCYRLKIHPLNHNQSLKSQRKQLSGQLCFFVTHLRVPYQYHDLRVESSTSDNLARAIRDLNSVTSLSSDDISSSSQSYDLAIRPLFFPEDELGTEALELRRASLALTLLYLASKSLDYLESPGQ
nr:reverse transcriptase domain-containing protein [Tanacetum cinerariifolium]